MIILRDRDRAAWPYACHMLSFALETRGKDGIDGEKQETRKTRNTFFESAFNYALQRRQIRLSKLFELRPKNCMAKWGIRRGVVGKLSSRAA